MLRFFDGVKHPKKVTVAGAMISSSSDKDPIIGKSICRFDIDRDHILLDRF